MPGQLPAPEDTRDDKDYLERDKLRAEIEKLRAETRSLRRARFLNPGSITTITSISAALLGWVTALRECSTSRNAQDARDRANATAEEFAQKNQDQILWADVGPAPTPTPVATMPSPSRTPPPTTATPISSPRPTAASQTSSSPTAASSPRLTPPMRTSPAPSAARISAKGRLYIYFANANQVGRMLGDVYSVFPQNGFEVIEAKQMPKERRPKSTEILYFDDEDRSDAQSLQNLLRTTLDVRSARISLYDPRNETVPTTGRKRHEFEIRFDRSVRSPVKGLIDLLDKGE